MSVIIYLEGGGDSKEMHSRCREAFRRLLLNCGFKSKMPRLVACGSRNAAFDGYVNANKLGKFDFVALWVDSEDLVEDINATWKHLARDKWTKPPGASDEQVLLMVTCMETWLMADRSALKAHFGQDFQESALLPLVELENRGRKEVLDKLKHSTRDCPDPYNKGKQSFELLGKLNPSTLETLLPSFGRVRRILKKHL